MRVLAVAGSVTLAAALVLMALRFLPTQSWVPAAQLVTFFPLALPLTVVALVLLLLARSRWPAVAAAVAAVVMVATISLRVVDQTGGSGVDTAGETVRVGAVNAYFGRADAAALTRSVQALELDVLCVAEATRRSRRRWRRGSAHTSSVVSAAEEGRAAQSCSPACRFAISARCQCAVPDARAAVETGGGEVTVTCAHPVPPTLGGPESWNPGVPGWSRELRALRDVTAATTGPQVVMGDFNATWDHRLLRRIADRSDLVSAANATGRGLTPTWPVVDGPLPFPFATIDHVLTDLPVLGADVVDVPGSDHRMVTATVQVPRSAP